MSANKILIVEDEGIVAMDIRQHLEGFGYDVVGTAYSGEQAITQATENRPQLVLMDIILKGGIDGISAAQTIIESLHIPIVFLTAYSDVATLERAKVTGAYGYLIKPFRPDELRTTIEVAMYKHEMEKKLLESEQWFAKTLHCLSDAVIATDGDARVRFMNPVAEELTGWQFDEVKGTDIGDMLTLIEETHRSPIANPVRKVLNNVESTDCRTSALLVAKTGEEIPVDESTAPIRDPAGILLGAVLILRDITTRLQMERALRESEECFRNAFDNASIGMALIDVKGRFLQVNLALCGIFGYSEKELLASSLQVLIHAGTYHTVIEHHLRQLMNHELRSFQIEVECFYKNIGKAVWTLLSASLVRGPLNEPQFFILQFQDITDRKYAEQQLLYVANHDPLTGLCNRIQFEDRMAQAWSNARRHKTRFALMFLDLDRFKLINDTLGHRVGDLLLQAVSDRLKSLVRANDTLARLGGDEFIVLLNDIGAIEDIARIAQKTIDTLTQPFSIEDNDIVVTASIGISVFPEDGENSQMLLMNADTAMYLAKERGKNNYQFYTLDMTARATERMIVERGLRQALANNELVLYYQPQINARNGHVVRVEVLLRWQHSEWGLVYPDRFIDVAEETGLIAAIGEWVLRKACLQAKSWQDNDGPVTHIAVNLSSRQFLEGDLFGIIRRILDETHLKSSLLELEITESAVMQDPDRALLVLRQLHDLGVQISIDDFGTGYSNLTYLRRFPIQRVKIDRSFIADIPDNRNSMTLVQGIIALAHELKLQVTVEGVETEEQLAFLIDRQCDFLQGYLFSPPMTADWLETEFRTDSIKTLVAGRSR